MSDYFKSPEYQAELGSLDLGPVISEVENYNEQYSIGKTMARYVLGHLDVEDGISTEEKETESREAFLQRIQNQYGIILSKSGTSLEPMKGTATIYGGQGKVETSKLSINLSDHKQFVEYLSALDTKITPSQIHGLVSVVENLTDQLQNEYSLDKPDPRAVELMASVQDVISNYKRLDPEKAKGLSQAVSTLEKFKDLADKNYLKEYLMIERAGLLDEVGGQNFGPSKWHTDSSPEGYQHRWQNALGLLDKIKKNSSAADLSIEVTSNLNASVDYAINDLKQVIVKRPDEVYETMLNTLEGVRKKLGKSLN